MSVYVEAGRHVQGYDCLKYHYGRVQRARPDVRGQFILQLLYKLMLINLLKLYTVCYHIFITFKGIT